MNPLDAYFLETLYAARDPLLVQLFIILTELGSTLVIGSGALALGLYLVVREKLSQFVGLCISIAGTALVVSVGKELVERARPDSLYQAYLETGFSLPSGHASLSLALYGFLVYFLWERYSQKRALLLGGFGALILLVGFSRMYLGLHYLTDVLAGYLVGGLFLVLGIYVAKRLSRHSIWF